MTTLLTGVNDVLKKAQLIAGDSGTLTTLTDSPRQTHIDNIVMAWNEVVEEIYSVAELSMPQEMAEATITLATNDRDYALATFNTLYWPFIDETNGQYLWEWKKGYLDLVNSQPVPADYTGLPNYAVIRPTDNQLYLDRIPSASESGLAYKYRYDKDISLSDATDTFPFGGEVYRALRPVVAGIFRHRNRKEAIDATFRSNIGRSARLLSPVTQRTHYGSRSGTNTGGIIFPFEE